ncbi:uncharacterized protein LOC131166960 isoform X2 [Malania oleifera]|uniref:uncharacterized protein LOC131166960 isoform X2 n=1 Tax=Malania oleifera TaxID=397392 RepID=UPI0025AE7439|nr:uncharacterized protein LOC131166960 isoform X2 [Malania oleifera]XP_057981634.1 uncharacterized protein LOC131166960 isoform X2 [Malania oleifera]
MGLAMSFMGTGFSPVQMLNLLMETLYKQFARANTKDFHDFQIAILDIFNTLNSALPGKHYDAPARTEIEEFFEEWKRTRESDKRTKFVNFMTEKISLGRPDNSIVITGLVIPPAAMATKRTAENAAKLRIVKAIPDVIFVPSITMLALISVKFTKKIFLGT